MIITAATQLVNALALGLLQNIPLILTAAVQLIAVIVGYLYKDAPKMMWDAGSNLIKGMWEGIKNNFGWLKENFVAEMMKVVAAVKNAMGIHSPSALFADQIGENMPLGIGEGWDQSMLAVRNHLAKSMLGLTNDLQTTISAPGMTATAGAGVGAASISFGDIYINVPGTSATPQQVAAAAQDGLLKALRSKGVN